MITAAEFLKYMQIFNLKPVGGGGGTVTNVGTGVGLTGGPITGTGVISIANTGVTAGNYSNIGALSVNAQGQLTSVTSGSPPLLSVMGTANQIGTSGTTAITVFLENDAVLPGTEGFVPPTGTTAQRPVSPILGQIRVNSDLGYLETWTSLGVWNPFDTLGGTVSSLTEGANIVLSPSTITTIGSIGLSPSYPGQASINTIGVITTGTWESDIISPYFGGTGFNNGPYTIQLGGNLQTISAGGANAVFTFTGPTSVTFPTSGVLSTTSGTVTSLSQGTGILLSSNPIVSSGSISLANTSVTPGSYTYATVTANAQGQVTFASSGTAPVTAVGVGTGLSSTGGLTPTLSITNTAVAPATYTNATVTFNAQGQATSASSGTAPITGITAGTGLSSTGGLTPTLSITSTGVSPGTYSFPINMAVNAQGQITSITSDGSDGGGSSNLFIGVSAGNNTTTGIQNVGIGYQALNALTTVGTNSASYNTALGYQALAKITGGGTSVASYSTAVGCQAAFNLTSGGTNTAIGYQAYYSATNTGGDNTVVGYQAMYSSTGANNNTVMGHKAMGVNTGSTGAANVAIGFQALYTNTTSNNTAIGYNALFYNNATGKGNNNTAVGYQAGGVNSNLAYTQCTFLGSNTDCSLTNLTNATAVGYGAIASVSNSLILGNGAYVGIGTSSPAYSLDIANVSSQAAMQLQTSTNTPTTPTVTNALLLFNNGGALSTKNTGGTVTAIDATTTITNNNSSSSTVYPTWVTGTSGNLGLNVSSTGLTYTPSTATLNITQLVPITDNTTFIGGSSNRVARYYGVNMTDDGSIFYVLGTGARFNYLTPSQAVVTNSTSNLVSMAYTSAATASTLMSRDSSGNSNTAALGCTTLTPTGVVNVTGSTGIPAATAPNAYWAGGYGSPTSGRIFIGDGTGYNFYLSHRTSSTSTDVVIFTDSGSFGFAGQLSFNTNIALQGPNTSTKGSLGYSWTTYSDERLKEEIEDADIYEDLHNVINIRTVKYKWSKGQGDNLYSSSKPKRYSGYIAQDVAKYLPTACSFDKDDIATSVDYAKVSRLHAGAIKALHQEIIELKRKLAS